MLQSKNPPDNSVAFSLWRQGPVDISTTLPVCAPLTVHSRLNIFNLRMEFTDYNRIISILGHKELNPRQEKYPMRLLHITC